MRFIFNTENVLVDMILEVHDKDEQLIFRVLLSDSERLNYVDFDLNTNELYLTLHTDKILKKQNIEKVKLLEDDMDLKRMAYKGVSKEEIDAEKELEAQTSYKDVWKSQQEEFAEDEEKRGFFDYVVSEDRLNFNYAYQTVLKNVGDDLQAIFFHFESLPFSNGTVIKAVAQGNQDNAIVPYECGQYFKRIPSIQEVERQYKKVKKVNRRGLYIVLAEILLGYGFAMFFTEHRIIWSIIVTILVLISREYFRVGNESIEEAYRQMKANEILSLEQLSKLSDNSNEHASNNVKEEL